MPAQDDFPLKGMIDTGALAHCPPNHTFALRTEHSIQNLFKQHTASYTDTAPPYPFPYFDHVFEFDWQEFKATSLKANSPAWQSVLFSSCESDASVISAFWHQVAWLSSTTALSGNKRRLFPFLKWKTTRFSTIYWVFITWRWYMHL